MSRVKFTADIVRSAVRHQVLERLGWTYWTGVGLLGCTFTVATISDPLPGFAFSAGTLLALACLAPLLEIGVRTRAALSRLLELDDGRMSIDIHAGRLRANSPFGHFDIPLNRITEVSCHDDFWLLKSTTGVLVSVPVVDLEWTTQQFWLEELRLFGAKVRCR